MSATQFIFMVLAAVIVMGSVMAVTCRKLLHSAVYLLFVLLGTAGLYFELNYHFLAVVQISVYIGGILVLLVFSVFLTQNVGEKMKNESLWKRFVMALVAVCGVTMVGGLLLNEDLMLAAQGNVSELDMAVIGNALLGAGKNQYILPFEIVSVLLLACIIGGVLVAMKGRDEEDGKETEK